MTSNMIHPVKNQCNSYGLNWLVPYCTEPAPLQDWKEVQPSRQVQLARLTVLKNCTGAI